MGGRFPAGVGRFWVKATRGCEGGCEVANFRWLGERLGRVGEGTARPLLSPVTRAGRRQCQVVGHR